ncbi:MAG: hypothetical protein ACLGHQ_12150, partial [Acidimicrobiia bacterium]
MTGFIRSVLARPAVIGSLLAVALAGAVVSGDARVVAATCWYPPVEANVRDPFRDPGCPWCPGNRGIEFATRPGQPGTAVAAGRGSFVGTVAG